MKVLLLALILISPSLAAPLVRCRVVAVEKTSAKIHTSKWVKGGTACTDLFTDAKLANELFHKDVEYRFELVSFGHKDVLKLKVEKSQELILPDAPELVLPNK